MRKFLYSIILTIIGLTAFSQSPTKFVNMRPVYPLVIGENTGDDLVYSHNGLYMYDIILDSLPHYEIGHIMNQTVRYLEDGVGFYVKADSLHSNDVVYSYDVDLPPIGPFEFNATTGRFKFYPDAGDYQTFNVTFTATADGNSLSQVVEFDIMPEVVPENLAIQCEGTMPSFEDYVILAESHTQMQLNNQTRTAYSYSVSGKDMVFDNNVQNKVWGLSGREDLYELNIYAERLFIRSALQFPQTNVTIYAKEIIFEDNENEIASINTTSSRITLLTNDNGIDGANAGNINLYINKLDANYAKRFILNGAQGQCANRNGTPGNGGNGGVLTSSIDVSAYCDFARGSAGVKYDVASRELTEVGSVIGAGQAGENGHFDLINDKYCWIHPYYFSAVIRHINDSYLNNYFSYSKTTSNFYYDLINEFMESDEWDSFDEILKIELKDQLTELEGMLYKLNANLDYFGNALGWAPMLSFEVLLNNYNNEIDRAMPTLYLNYWLGRVDQTLTSWVTASEVAADETMSEIAANQNQINNLIGDIPVIEDKIAEVTEQIDIMTVRLEMLQAYLLEKAKDNVSKRNRINKAFGVFNAAVNCIPIFGGVASTIASVAGTVAGFAGDYFQLTDSYGYESAITGVFNGITGFNYGNALQTIQNAINGIDLNNLGQSASTIQNAYNSLSNSLTPVINSITNLRNVMAQSSIPDEQVNAEFNRLCAESPDYNNIMTELEILSQKAQELDTYLQKTFTDITTVSIEVSNNIVALDALRRDVFTGNSKRDLQAMQCVAKMQQRAKSRLLKYHYYMRKAYEYRLLQPYYGEFNLVGMFERLESMGVMFDSINPVNPTAYNTLSTIFREEISGIVEEVMQEYTTNSPEQSAPITIVIPRETLDILNADENYILNLYELGIFAPDEENVRIVDLGVQHIETHVVGNVGYSGYVDVNMEHNGISRFRKNGEIYWFNHISNATTNPHTWGIRYDVISHETTTIQPSYASQSLLYSLLGSTASNNIMLFSRPAAWSDIIMSKKVHTSGNADIIIDSLVLRLQYDFTRRPNTIRNIDISTNEGLTPYIMCSETDRNGRSNGKGSFLRSYNRSNNTVTFTATEKYGTYHFVNWTDRFDNVVSEEPDLTVTKQTDQFYKANYERWIPILSIPDTIYIGPDAGEYMVDVRNVGLGDIDMDWYVSDSQSQWIHLNGITDGINDGYFTFNYESTNVYRIDSLEIFAPETEVLSKMIYVVQYNDSYKEVTVNVEPEGAGVVDGAGFYEINTEVTLTATPINSCTFVSWKQNGQIVSTQNTYTFVITSNVQITANFDCDNMVSVSAEVVPECSGYVEGTGLYNIGDLVTLKAIPYNNYIFNNWMYNTSVVSNLSEYSFIALDDLHYIANFQFYDGVNEFDENTLKIYPNPAKNYVYIECEDIEVVTLFSIITSQEVFINKGCEKSIRIDLSNVPHGLYYLQIKTKDGVTIRKVIKQ